MGLCAEVVRALNIIDFAARRVAFTLALAVVACSASTTKPDATVGAQCQQILYAACTRAITDCGLTASPWIAPVDQCVTSSEPACCNGDCARTATSSEDSIQACQRALQAASCAALSAVDLPAECQHVVQ